MTRIGSRAPSARRRVVRAGLTALVAALAFTVGASSAWGAGLTPTVSFQLPANGSAISGDVTFTADASDDQGVVQVTFFFQGQDHFATLVSGSAQAGVWQYVFDTTAVPDGPLSVSAQAMDPSDESPADQRSFEVDNLKPSVSITSGPAAVTTSTSAAFVFSTVNATGIGCALDPVDPTNAASYVACDSAVSQSYSGLAVGSHSFYVRVSDDEGNVVTASSTWTVSAPVLDTTAPRVTHVRPVAGATGVSRGANVSANFSERVDPASITSASVELFHEGSATAVPAHLTLSTTGRFVLLNPARRLDAGATYVAMVTTAVRDLAGNALAAGKTWSFTVAG